MRKITFFWIALLLQKIIDFLFLKIKRFISAFFGLAHDFPLKASIPTPDLPKGICKVIKLEKFQKADKIQDCLINMDCTFIDDLSPEIRSIIMYNIMEAFSAKLPTPYHQRKIMRIGKTKSHRNEKYQILQNLN